MEQDKNNAVAATRTIDASVSFVAGSVLLVIALFIGAFYMMNSDNMNVTMMPNQAVSQGQMMQGTPEEIAATESATIAATAALSTQGTSDELSAIEADLNATDLSSLGGVNQI